MAMATVTAIMKSHKQRFNRYNIKQAEGDALCLLYFLGMLEKAGLL